MYERTYKGHKPLMKEDGTILLNIHEKIRSPTLEISLRYPWTMLEVVWSFAESPGE
jgi:hypothetical protein